MTVSIINFFTCILFIQVTYNNLLYFRLEKIKGSFDFMVIFLLIFYFFIVVWNHFLGNKFHQKVTICSFINQEYYLGKILKR